LRCLIEAIGYYFPDKKEKLQDLVKCKFHYKIKRKNFFSDE